MAISFSFPPRSLMILIGVAIATTNVNATPTAEPSQKSINEYIASYVRSINSNKVKARNGNVAFFEDTSILITASVGGCGALCLGGGAVLFFADRYANREQKIIAGLIGLIGTGFLGLAAYRIFTRHMKNILTYFLDEKGIYKDGLLLVSWSNLAKIEKGSSIIVSGNMAQAVNYISLLDKFGHECTKIFDGSESLPVSCDQFIAIVEEYWNTYKNQ
jgi:hypothetical protein